MSKIVPFFDYKHIFGQYRNELMNIVTDVAERGAFIMQDEMYSFEHNLAAFLSSKHALGVGNCTDGLLLALKAADIGNGDEVIFSSHTFFYQYFVIYQTF